MKANFSRNILRSLICLLALCALASASRAETLRKRYTFDFNPATRHAGEQRAQALARKSFLRDFLSAKFSKEIVTNLAEDIDIALDPPDEYLLSFDVVSTKEDGNQLTLTVEGDVDLPGMITALVRNKVLSFGERPAKIMFLPSSRVESPKAAKALRALLFDKLRQAGLQSVDFEGATEILSTQIKGKVTPNSVELRTLQKLVTQYNADYLLYVDTESDNRPASVGGYICDANFIYTVVRPNNNLILAESAISARGSGNTSMLAFDKALDKAAPDLINQAVGQLYQAIYSDSDVIYNTPQLRNTIAVTIYEGKPNQVKKIIEALQADGATVSLGAGTGISSRMTIDTTFDTLALYNYFNELTITTAAGKFKTPVVGYAENSIDLEITDLSSPPRRPKPPKAPAPRPQNTGGGQPAKPENIGQGLVSQVKARTQPAVVLKLKPLVPTLPSR